MERDTTGIDGSDLIVHGDALSSISMDSHSFLNPIQRLLVALRWRLA
jgi:hypothetical protein